MQQPPRKISLHAGRIRRYSVILVAIWTMVIACSLFREYQGHDQNVLLIARVQARAFFEKDLLYRLWASRHGGVYVPVTASTPPNPYLAHIPERDIVSPSGRRLTLMNPAYMTRQMYEMTREYQQTGRGHITSLRPLRPENAPDAWERAALQVFETGSDEFGQILEMEGKPYYRYMRRLVAEKTCLKCHARQGYAEGDVRGGISVSVPLEPFYAIMGEATRSSSISHSAIWLVGIGFIVFGGRRLERVTETLAEEELKYRTLFQQAAVGVAQVDTATGTFLKINRRYADIIGYSPEELRSRDSAEITHPEDLDLSRERLRALMAGDIESFSIEVRYLHRDNRAVWVLLTVSPMWQPGEAPTCHVAVIQDITDRRRAEEQLHEQTVLLEREVAERQVAQEALLQQAFVLEREIAERRQAEGAVRLSEEKFARSFENAPVMMTISRVEDGTYLEVNNRFLELSGFARAEVLGRTFLELGWIIAEDRDRLLEELRRSGRISGMEVRLNPKGRKPLVCLYYAELINIDGSQRLLSIAQDITEHRQLEEQLRQSLKMESIGRLAGGIAHDFNNKLTVILGYAEISKLSMPEGEQAWLHLNEIVRAAEHSRDIIRQLLAFSRQQVSIPRPLDLNRVVKDTERTLAHLIGEDIILSFTPGDDLWIVNIDPSQVDQIIMNLAVNARDAMPGGGRIAITTANIRIDQAYCHEYLEAKPGEYVQLTVQDNGTGIERETLQHIFEPFFTTKEAGKGTGLGLATVYGIIRQNDGFINVYSEPGYGTLFKIFLPRFTQPVAADTGEPATAVRGAGHVLLVEDDEAVRRMTTAMLEMTGYTVLSADGPEDALAICEQGEQPIDIILSDVIMPGMSGKEVMDRILRVRPGIKVLYMSGYTADFIAQRGVMDMGIHFIQKPFTMNTLNAVIKEIL